MAKSLFSCSKGIKMEYCCSIVKIGEVFPIEGKDKIGYTMVNGLSMVIRKDSVKTGDIMFYAMNETQLDEKFLAANNLFCIDEYDKNSNAVEVGKLLSQGKNDEAKMHVGFFNKFGRVKLIRLGGIPSYGFLFSQNELAKAYPKVADINLEELVGTDFDSIDGEVFIQGYIPPVKEGTPRKSRNDKRNNKLFRFKRLIPGKFSYHYDTGQFPKDISLFKPDEEITITLKIHGTSAIFGNILTKAPKWGGLYGKAFIYLPSFLQFSVEKYGFVYSSRSVIKNEYINNKVTKGFYGTDIWGEYAARLDGKIPEGMIVYGEIFGYLTESQKMIQKNYDYGCPVGTNKIMFYRITTENEDGTKREWEVQEVYDWTLELIKKYPELTEYIHPIDILYIGTLQDLYPEIDIANHWHENVLEAMKKDKKHFGMEMNEPLCKKKVPREGIVIRKNHDEHSEAWKLKCSSFLMAESNAISQAEENGDEYEDIEMAEQC